MTLRRLPSIASASHAHSWECPIVSRLLDNKSLKTRDQYSCNKADYDHNILGHFTAITKEPFNLHSYLR
jgi:hypothetical protein